MALIAGDAGGRFDMREPGGKVWTLRRDNHVNSVSVDGRIDSNSLTAVIGAAIREFGQLFAPRWVVEEYFNRGELEIVLANYEVEPYENEMWVSAFTRRTVFFRPKSAPSLISPRKLHEPT